MWSHLFKVRCARTDHYFVRAHTLWALIVYQYFTLTWLLHTIVKCEWWWTWTCPSINKLIYRTFTIFLRFELPVSQLFNYFAHYSVALILFNCWGHLSTILVFQPLLLIPDSPHLTILSSWVLHLQILVSLTTHSASQRATGVLEKTFWTSDELVCMVDVIALIHFTFLLALPQLRGSLRLLVHASTHDIAAAGSQIAHTWRWRAHLEWWL